MSVAVPNTVRSGTVRGDQFIVLELSALSSNRAKKRAQRYARAKGYAPATIERMRNIGGGRVPGSTKYRIRIESPR